MDEPSMTLKPIPITVPAELTEDTIAHYQCLLVRSGKLAVLDDGERRIDLVLVASGILIVIGLACCWASR
jgi:hypothetical protein